MKRKYELFIKDILENIEIIFQFTENMTYNDFKKDTKTIYAVTRSLEIIGEAVNNIPEEIKQKNKEIPWRDIKNFRNIVIHQYWKIDYEAQWQIIKQKLPELKQKIKKI